jgi:hypothetical protein
MSNLNTDLQWHYLKERNIPGSALIFNITWKTRGGGREGWREGGRQAMQVPVRLTELRCWSNQCFIQLHCCPKASVNCCPQTRSCCSNMVRTPQMCLRLAPLASE